jgi:alpha-mannosidase
MPYAKAQMQSQIRQTISDIKKAIYTVIGELTMTAWVTPEPVPFNARMSGKKMILHIGDKWGELWDCAWFYFEGRVPVEGSGKKVVFLIDVGGEALVFDDQGFPIQGLTNQNSEFDLSLGEPGKRVVFFSENAKSGQMIHLWIDAGTNDLFGKYRDGGKIQSAFIAICNDSFKTLYYDMKFLFELMQSLPENSARHDKILFALYEATLGLHGLTEKEIDNAEAIIATELCKRSGDPSLSIRALGHSHIDLAWLWPLRETVRKGARTFATALWMMERYPEYVFGASQPQLYQWIKGYYPQLYQKIHDRVSEGRWETLGGMWVECDTNLPGGESLIRQLLYGKKFFQQEFDEEVKIAWLPDSFGYSAALPQLFKKSGIDYFCTTKISWNLYDQFPHHTFIWKGIDGSMVLAHMPPEGTYNGSAAPKALVKAEMNYIDKGVSDQCLMLFGIGDGGGGPGEEHLEMLCREKHSADLPPVRQQKAIDFFTELSQSKEKYQTWQGELYLERHQGTYTTRARNKRLNRKIEIALHDLEFLASLATIVASTPYPSSEIETIWKEVLLYQFHDILPGSAIGRVYQETENRYNNLFNWVNNLKTKTLANLSLLLDTACCQNPAFIFNSTSWTREEWFKINYSWYFIRVPAFGYRVIDLNIPSPISSGVTAGENWLENDELRIEWDLSGAITRLYDKINGFEMIAPENYGNRLAVYLDNGDAWDIPIGYADKIPEYFQLMETENRVDGPRASVKHRYVYGNSRLEQEIVIYFGSRRVDFITKVDWQEHHKMLRVGFPFNIQNSTLTCEIQFGYLHRPNQKNTTWEMAQYEICAQKWVDLSNSGYGVALLNNCKYGHKVIGNTLDLDLLRSTTYPDPDVDIGTHEFTYALFPHKGNHLEGSVIRQGYQLNYPLTIIEQLPKKVGSQSEFSLITAAPENIIVETIKKAEDSSTFVVRLYESAGCSTLAKLIIHWPVKCVQLADLMEQPYDVASLGSEFELPFHPFEIHTLKVKFNSIH